MKIILATDYTKHPGARYEYEGAFSGERFRNDILFPKLSDAINKKEKLEIVLDGTAGIGTSFLEESFGGLIRNDKLKYEDIIDTLIFISNEEPDYIEEIKEYLRDAKENEK